MMKTVGKKKMGCSPLKGLSPGVLGTGFSLLLSCCVSTASVASDLDQIDPDAFKILTDMSEFLGDLPGFSADFDATADIITSQGQKLKLAASGNVLLSRPRQFRVKRLGSLAEMEFVLDGETLTLYGTRVNGYLELPAVSIDEAITKIRNDVGFEVPGADILSASPFDLDVTDVVSGVHVGMTTVSGVPVHHLAFRGNQVDWQVWVTDGEDPLPVKYVITSKLMAGAPEYALLVTNWDTQPQFDDATFAFVPPPDARSLSSLAIDAAGNISQPLE
jgi:hypothetical protein